MQLMIAIRRAPLLYQAVSLRVSDNAISLSLLGLDGIVLEIISRIYV